MSWLRESSLPIATDCEHRGGVLIHGGLAVRDGNGIILAGPGGRGKTTTSARLPLPWRSLSDDASLVVCDREGTYWGHPWPTWSRWLYGHTDATWDVQQAARLRGIFFIARSPHHGVEPLGMAHAISLLVEVVEQINRSTSQDQNTEYIRQVRLRRFANLCALAKAVPAYTLQPQPDESLLEGHRAGA